MLIVKDPNDNFNKFHPVNGLPDTQNFITYAELYVVRYNKVNAVINENGTIDLQGKDRIEKINMLGFNPEEELYTNEYATRITGGDSKKPVYEGFGITDIDIKINSGFVPQVTIQFIDIKGSGMFNSNVNKNYNENNDTIGYGILYDFPPPLYVLKMKGVYGFATRYFLHLTKVNSVYDSSTGNFNITASFVGKAFGPLSDVKIGWIKAMSRFNNNEPQTTNELIAPRSFGELLLRGDSLYKNITETVSDSTETKEINEINSKIQSINERINENFVLDGYESTVTLGTNNLYVNGERYDDCYYVKYTSPDYDYKPNEYNKLISDLQDIKKQRLNAHYIELTNDRNTANDIRVVKKENVDEVYFIYTNYIKKLKDSKAKIEKDLNDKSVILRNKIENLTIRTLGMVPTLKKVLKLLCDDVDKFFNELNKSAQPKEKGGDVLDNASYPRVQKEIGGLAVDIYPGSDNRFTSWSEVQFVENFIRAASEQNSYEETVNALSTLSNNGLSKWVPSNPLEAPGTTGIVDSEYLNVNDDATFFETLLKRYLVTTQYSYKTLLHEKANGLDNTREDKNFVNKQGLMDYISKGEVLNVINSISNKKFALRLNQIANEYVNKLKGSQNFDVLKDISQNKLYFGSTTLEAFLKGNNNTFNKDSLNIRNNVVYPNRLNPNYKGFSIITQKPETVSTTVLEDGTPEKYLADSLKQGSSFLKNITNNLLDYFGYNRKPYPAYLTKNNIYCVLDDSFTSDSDGLESDYLTIGNLQDYLGSLSFITKNTSSINENIYTFAALLSGINLTNNSVNPIDGITYTSDINLNLLKTLFTLYKDVEDNSLYYKFSLPGVIEIPYFFLVKIGYEIKFNNKMSYLSVLDRNYLIKVFDDFMVSSDYTSLISLLNESRENSDIKPSKSRLQNNIEGIKNIMLKQVYMQINSSLTFSKTVDNNNNLAFFNFEPIESVENNVFIENNQKRINSYLLFFFNELKTKLSSKIDELSQSEQSTDSLLKDNDFKNKLYYEFKDVYDKWIVGGGQKSGQFSYPFNNGTPLIDKFKIFDRTYNPIGDKVIVDFRPLIDYAQNPDAVINGALSALLAKNNFDFYPLPNFIDYKNISDNIIKGKQDKDTDLFVIDTDGDVNVEPTFLCMYIGATSSNLDLGPNSYNEDDGIYLDGSKPNSAADLASLNTYVFKVSQGLQNQSVFGNIALETNDFSDTSESLKIMDEIFSRGRDKTQTPKGQNLFDVNSKRSFSTTINIPFGNMMLQPTQYLQLCNISQFSGVYMIREVTHKMDNTNLISTTFKATRVGRLSKPLITESFYQLGNLIPELTSAYGLDRNINIISSPGSVNSIVGADVCDYTNGDFLKGYSLVNREDPLVKTYLNGGNKNKYFTVKYKEGSSVLNDLENSILNTQIIKENETKKIIFTAGQNFNGLPDSTPVYDSAFLDKIDSIVNNFRAKGYGIPGQGLLAKIHNESAGTYLPYIINNLGYTGLIQFDSSNQTYRGFMGKFANRTEFFNFVATRQTNTQQLDAVEKYYDYWFKTLRNKFIANGYLNPQTNLIEIDLATLGTIGLLPSFAAEKPDFDLGSTSNGENIKKANPGLVTDNKIPKFNLALTFEKSKYILRG